MALIATQVKSSEIVGDDNKTAKPPATVSNAAVSLYLSCT
jgi:hypothetical protein